MINLIHSVLWFLFSAALCILGWHLQYGNVEIQLFCIDGFGLNNCFKLRVDTLSSLMVVMITLLGAIIGKYSLRYLRGEKRQAYFYHYLLFTITSATFLVLSNHLLMFFAMWLFSSLGLHQLLLYSPERKQAVSAAYKKFFVSRVGDIALLLAIVLTYHTFQTFDFSELFLVASQVVEDSPQEDMLSLIGVLYVLGAITKSAQFPFHFWLPETMETPAPISALMHAGIINAGGFLVIRLSPLLQHAEIAHMLLALFGSVTATFGALVMITQNDIKKKLAFSTISQMGVMMVSCGLGAYSLALFHIISHSFYKAHAFLSTGFLVDKSKKVKFNHSKPSVLFLVAGATLGYLLITFGLIFSEGKYVAYFTYAAILMLGFVQNIDFGEQAFFKLGFRFFFLLLSIFIFSLGVCLVFESFLHEKLVALTPLTWGHHGNFTMQVITCFVSYTTFVVALGFSALLIESKGSFTQKLYIYFWNGGYFQQRTNFFFNQNTSKQGLNS